ncbi:MAG: DNA mismatch repair protein MutS [Bacteroidetes bacterium]|nr:DNA mismatch repair protein MutS [Bacteroidota bacterium]
MAKPTADTPLMKQHKAIKQKYPDAILLFRVGDFYETFGSDAIITSKVLGITLTKRNNNSDTTSELAGFPHHALDTYLHKLVKAGYRVAICDQLEDPKLAKGIVKRGVTEMVTPGIATNDKLIEHNSNNFLACVYLEENKNGLALLDITTGEFLVAEGNDEYIDKLLQSLKPSEVIIQRNMLKKFKELFGVTFYTYALDAWIFESNYTLDILLKHFQTHSLKGFGIENLHNGIMAAGAILHYLKETEHPHIQHIRSIQRIEQDDYVWMDRFTIRNLEILPEGFHAGNCLLKTLDNSLTPMGARLLKRWVVLPLKDLQKINERLDAVEFLVKETDLRKQIDHHLKQCGDLERLVSKISMKKISPREMIQLAKSLKVSGELKNLLLHSSSEYFQRLSDTINPCQLITEQIIREIIENPPALAQKGGLIQTGVHAELDALREISRGGKNYLVELQQRESEATGIHTLKIGFNNVFGYYLEVTNTHKNKVPRNWMRKQTLTTAERYITQELKEYEEKITGAEEKILALELQIYDQLMMALQDYMQAMQVNGHALATIDCLSCFAGNAIQYFYKKPEIHEGQKLALKESRHPVIERGLPPGESYIANDITLDPEFCQIIILTGPNMSGKSALLRQTALITLMAHIGSFVPVSEALIPLTDKIFTRVGASDNLSGGESTFMVEMNETASIINNISKRSLILLDEIGRGTSTYDGISIAWSIVEYLHQSPFTPKTLFATHYHELNEIEEKLMRVKNFHIAHHEAGNKIIFLRKLTPGGSTHSFGIHVAKMAGLPPELIERANEVLKQLEEKQVHESDDAGSSDLAKNVKKLATPQIQLSIFDAQTSIFENMRQTLKDLDINRLTPVEALLKLNELKNLLN